MGITKNQSSSDGISYLPGMRLPACTCAGQDHPTAGKSRSAPEIDAIEASVSFLDPPADNGVGSASQSLQIAPFDIWYEPDTEFVEVFDASVTSMNVYRGGPYQQAVSAVTNLNNQWYDGKEFQTYAFEYEPGEDGNIWWYVGADKTWHIDARALGPNGNVGQRVIPQEPMAIVANFGLSSSFAALNMTGLAALMPATMRIDYIRIYQSAGHSVGCDPPGYETTEYIAEHPKAYLDRDAIRWFVRTDTPRAPGYRLTLSARTEAGYAWPTNSFVDTCAA